MENIIIKKNRKIFVGKYYAIKIPNNLEIIKEEQGIVSCKREDGLIIFLNSKDDKVINLIRLYGKKEDVIFVVGMYRGMQIADNYSKLYNYTDSKDRVSYTYSLVESIIKKYNQLLEEIRR